jgi:LytR cell envelope-related transcriptional attenuator
MVARLAVWGLGLLVAALVLSWGYARFAPRRQTPVAGAARRVIRVQVWNGSGEGGVGARVASYLRAGGFHVVEVRNADRSDYFASMVVARQRDEEAARVVARYLGDPPVIRQASASDAADVTVVLGRDRSRLHLED